MIYHTINQADRALEQAHKEWLRLKKQTLTNQKNLKQCYDKLLKDESISKDTYEALIRIANNTINFLNQKEI